MKKQQKKNNKMPKKTVVKAKSTPKKTSKVVKTEHKSKKKFSLDIRTWRLTSLATLGPIGFFPKGPGTMGALVALPFAYVLNHFSVPLLWIFTFLIFGIGFLAVQQYTANKTEKDPSCVIIDEVVGQLIPFMVVIPDFMHWPMLLLGFVLFRFFDIFKFGTVAFWDRRKNPMGVMMDDVCAGIFAGFVLSMIQVVLVEFYGM